MSLRDLVEAGGVAAVVTGAGLAFGGVGLLIAGLALIVACEARG